MSDIFLCYRSRGAQTAKLFKRYMVSQGGAEVWYSDDEAYGNYKTDIPQLISQAKCAVLFITEDFFQGFLEKNGEYECITGLEVTEIERKLQQDPEFRMLTVYLDRGPVLPEEQETLAEVFRRAGILTPESVGHFTQSNRIPFNTRKDYENDLFRLLRTAAVPVVNQRDTALGSFTFCGEPTNVDIIQMDVQKPIEIAFSEYSGTVPFHNWVARAQSNAITEQQNDDMISVVGWECSRETNTDNMQLLLSYKPIEYRLFHKCIQLWDSPTLKIREKMQEYDFTTPGALFEIPNAMGLAMMVVTADNCLVFSRRSRNRRIRSGEFDCSIVEGLKIEVEDEKTGGYDVYDREYVENECLRAYREEISFDAEGVIPKVNGVILDRGYGQWNIAGTIFTPKTSEELSREHPYREDTYEQNELIFVKADKLKKALTEMRHVGMWDTALAVLELTLLRMGIGKEYL